MRWTKERLALTAQLVERLVGHRTALAQEPEQDGLDAADRAIDRYGQQSQILDGSSRRLQVVPSRVWLLGSLLALAPSFATGQTSVTSLAVALAGILFARQGLQRLLQGLDRIIGAGVSWKQLKQFLDASRRHVEAGDPDFCIGGAINHPAAPIVPFPTQRYLGSLWWSKHANCCFDTQLETIPF